MFEPEYEHEPEEDLQCVPKDDAENGRDLRAISQVEGAVVPVLCELDKEPRQDCTPAPSAFLVRPRRQGAAYAVSQPLRTEINRSLRVEAVELEAC
jgi:hypothetical protein